MCTSVSVKRIASMMIYFYYKIEYCVSTFNERVDRRFQLLWTHNHFNVMLSRKLLAKSVEIIELW